MYDDKDIQGLYDENYFSHRTRPEMWNRRADYVLKKFNPKTALDIGCASGEFVKSMIDVGIDAYGIDGSDFAISKVEDSIKNKIFKVNLNSVQFPFEDNTFDFIGSFYSVEHIHNIGFFSQELFRTLKNSGIVLNARMVGSPEIIKETTKKLWEPGMKLLVVTFSQSAEEQKEAYDIIHSVCK